MKNCSNQNKSYNEEIEKLMLQEKVILDELKHTLERQEKI